MPYCAQSAGLFSVLFSLQCLKGKEGERDECHCIPIPFYAFAGDSYNPATFWIHRYYDPSAPRPGTVSLLRVGSQVVIDAGTISSGSIRGLEAVWCDSTGIYKISDDQIRALADDAQKRSRRLQKTFLAW